MRSIKKIPFSCLFAVAFCLAGIYTEEGFSAEASPPVTPVTETVEQVEEKSFWNNEVELSYLVKRGNSVSDSLQGKYLGEYKGITWRQTLKLEASNAESYSDDTRRMERTDERYYGSYKLDRNLANQRYLYNLVTVDDDNFSGFEYQLAYSAGYGVRLVETTRTEFELEVGPGYRVKRFEHGYADENALLVYWQASGGDVLATWAEKKRLENSDYEKGLKEEGVLRLAGKFHHKINEHVEFREDASTEVGRFSATSRAETSLTAELSRALSFRFSHLVTHNSQVPKGKKEADHETSLSLVYKF